MVKVVGMLVALAMFCAMPAVAFAGSSGDNVSSGNTQTGEYRSGCSRRRQQRKRGWLRRRRRR